MDTASTIRDWLRGVLEAQPDLTVKQWAAKARVAPSTIHRAMGASYQFVTSSKTLAKLAVAAGVAPPDAKSTEPLMVDVDFLPIRYEVGAGNWQEIADNQTFFGVGTVAPDPAYTGFAQWLERVQGDSMDREYRPGDLVHVVDAIALGYAPRHGDHVVLVRRRMDGSEMERTIKEVVRRKDGATEFWPRSNNPRWNSPITLFEGVATDDTTEVEVGGLVIGSYRPRR
jgi:phage repressor protein C with HTH and peptisase S24 domain